MTVVTKPNERIAALSAAGTAVWLDEISRSLTRGGELRGVTTNPAIFEKAISGIDMSDVTDTARRDRRVRHPDEIVAGRARVQARSHGRARIGAHMPIGVMLCR